MFQPKTIIDAVQAVNTFKTQAPHATWKRRLSGQPVGLSTCIRSHIFRPLHRNPPIVALSPLSPA